MAAPNKNQLPFIYLFIIMKCSNNYNAIILHNMLVVEVHMVAVVVDYGMFDSLLVPWNLNENCVYLSTRFHVIYLASYSVGD